MWWILAGADSNIASLFTQREVAHQLAVTSCCAFHLSFVSSQLCWWCDRVEFLIFGQKQKDGALNYAEILKRFIMSGFRTCFNDESRRVTLCLRWYSGKQYWNRGNVTNAFIKTSDIRWLEVGGHLPWPFGLTEKGKRQNFFFVVSTQLEIKDKWDL